MRTERVFRKNANSNITVTWTVTRDSRGTVFGQPLGRNNCRCQGVSKSSTVMNLLQWSRRCVNNGTVLKFRNGSAGGFEVLHGCFPSLKRWDSI